MNILVFEDATTNGLFPITTGKPAYAITCAGFQLHHWLSQLPGNLVGMVRTHLETLQLHDFPDFANTLDAKYEKTWLINARLAPSVSNIQRLHQFRETHFDRSKSVVARQRWAVAAAIVPTSELIDQSQDQCRQSIAQMGDTNDDSVEVIETGMQLFDYPHEVIDHHLNSFRENLEYRISIGQYDQPQKAVYLGQNVVLSDHCRLDTSEGPIVIENGVQVGPFTLLKGPIYIGANSKVNEHASIKDRVAIGHTCKIGGEIESSIIEPFSNKQHHGFLGHSYLGSWVNLGAGTCNSDLKNTYGHVNMQYGDRKVASGMQFVGCIAGDYVKTAINTSIFTGKLIGTGAMVYGFATTNVPSFVNYARLFGEIGNLPPEVIVSTQSRMFARRNVTQRPCDVQLVHDMYRLTESERPAKLTDDPLSL